MAIVRPFVTYSNEYNENVLNKAISAGMTEEEKQLITAFIKHLEGKKRKRPISEGTKRVLISKLCSIRKHTDISFTELPGEDLDKLFNDLDSAYAAKIGGYDQGCILASNDYTRDYISLIPNNLTDPNGSGTAGKWAIYSGAGSIASATASIAGIVKIVDNLSSTAVDAALTANQGKVLNDVLDIIAYSPIPYFGDSAPSGFLAMHGQTITSAQYPKLFARYGSSLPDLRGCFIRGLGGNSDALGVVQGDAIRNITGTFSPGGFIGGLTGVFSNNGGPAYTSNSGLASDSRLIEFDASTQVPTASENRPRNIAFLYIVKAG